MARMVNCVKLGKELPGMRFKPFKDELGQKVCAISVVTWRPSGPLLEVLGDESHLPPELREDGGT